MKLQIDTVNKTLTILSKIDLNQLLSFIKEYGMEDWSVEPEIQTKWLTPQYNVPYIFPVDPYSPPYIIT